MLSISISQIMFETFNVRGLRMEQQPVLAMYALQHLREQKAQLKAQQNGQQQPLYDVRNGSAFSQFGASGTGAFGGGTFGAASNPTALVVDAGFRYTHVVPITEGFVLKSNIRRMNLGGKHVTDLIHEALVDRKEENIPQEYR
jgi:actin-related protein